MEKFSFILKDLIVESEKSLRTIEKESGIPSSQLSRYLKNTTPSLKIATKLAIYFHCSLDYLFGINDIKNIKTFSDCDLSKFVERYEKALSDNNTTHYKFSKQFQISEALLRHWKYGDTPKLDNLVIISENLGVSIDYLVGRTNIK